ncbi:hypothetical protein D3C71_1577650 [compost metagenome]
MAALQRAVAVGLAAEPHRCGDETLHQVAFRWTDIGLVDIDAAVFQQLFQLDQLAVLPAVKPHYRAMVKVSQRQGFQLQLPLLTQQQFSALALFGRDKGYGDLRRQTKLLRPIVGRQPKLHLGAGRRITPVAGEQKALLE